MIFALACCVILTEKVTFAVKSVIAVFKLLYLAPTAHVFLEIGYPLFFFSSSIFFCLSHPRISTEFTQLTALLYGLMNK